MDDNTSKILSILKNLVLEMDIAIREMENLESLPTSGRRMSKKGYDLLKEWEGKAKAVYLDSKGNWTIGYGHLLTQEEQGSDSVVIDGETFRFSDGLSDMGIDLLLRKDVIEHTKEALKHMKYPALLNQDQFDAIMSFVFNVGVPQFADSTLLRRLNEGNFDDVPHQLRRWVYVGKAKSQGLINRREKEIKLWNGEL